MDDKLRNTLNLIQKLAATNKDFKAELQNLYGGTSSAKSIYNSDILENPISTGNDKLDAIYEHCIEEILDQQAKEFYKNFPLGDFNKDLIKDLKKNFKYMELYKRRDEFCKFCQSIQCQVEGIVNMYCESPCYIDLCKKIDKDILSKLSIYNLPGSQDPMHFMDKVGVVLYFIYYSGELKYISSYYNIYNNFRYLSWCRNSEEHGKSTSHEDQEDITNKIIANKGVYYLKYTSLFYDFIEHINQYYHEQTYLGSIKQKDEKNYEYTIKLTNKLVKKIDVNGREIVSKYDNQIVYAKNHVYSAMKNHIFIGDIVNVTVDEVTGDVISAYKQR